MFKIPCFIIEVAPVDPFYGCYKYDGSEIVNLLIDPDCSIGIDGNDWLSCSVEDSNSGIIYFAHVRLRCVNES